MSSTQIVEAWNKCFDYKITVPECKRPTQSFLFEALQCFLKSTHIDCTKLKAKMDERQYKLLVVKYFNEFLKATGHTKNFLYGDLIHPDSQKTRTMLQFLTNYYVFFDMVKTNVIGAANEKIATYNKLFSKKTHLQLKHEEAKIQLEKKEEALKEYTRLIAENKKLLEELKTKSASLTKDTEKANEQLLQIREENIKLECLVNELEPLVVTEDEMKKLAESVKVVDDEIVELNSTYTNMSSINQNYVQEINQISDEIEEFGKMNNESVVVEFFEKYREEKKGLTEMGIKMQEFRNQIESMKAQQEEFVKKIQFLERELLNKKNNLNSVLEDSELKKQAMDSEYKHRAIHTANLEKKLELAEQNVESLKLYQEQLITKGIEVIEFIENS